jgi:hypothetical protein
VNGAAEPRLIAISSAVRTVVANRRRPEGGDVKRRPIQITAALATLALLAVGAGAFGWERTKDTNAQAASSPVRLADATMIVEVNATDGDAGLQVFLDGEPWRSMSISGPDGRTMLAVNAEGRLENFGLTELFSESSEPPFDVFPLEQFKTLFPEGRYSFEGTTVEGARLVGRATLTHNIPDRPEIISPAAGSTVAPNDVVARWLPVTTPARIDVVGYRAIVTREDPLRVFSVDLPASVTAVTVSPEFLESGVEYKLEVQAIEAGGNQTLTEIAFLVN